MRLWKFTIEDSDGDVCYTANRPPGWSDNMKKAEPVIAPEELAQCFTAEAQEAFRREHGTDLHSVVVHPDGSMTKHGLSKSGQVPPVVEVEAETEYLPDPPESDVEDLDADPLD